MAIIYTYPIKTDPVSADKVLISDSEDNNKTKSVTIEDIRSATVSGVSSIIAGYGINLPSGSTGDVTIDATEYVGGDGIDIRTVGSTFSVAADLKANSGLVIDTATISLDLSASNISGTLAVKDGGSGAATFTAGFLKANGTSAFTTVSEIDLTTDVTEALPVLNGGTGAGSLTGLIVGNGTSAMTDGGDIDNLVSASFSTASGGSLYFGNIPSAAPSTGENIFIGSGSGNNITSVSGSNTIVGSGSVTALTSGGANVVIGTQAGTVLQVGSENTIVGRRANVIAQGDNHVVAVGSGATATLDGTAVGAESTALRDGIAIGYEATAARDGIAIGSGSTAAANELALGSSTHALTTATGTATLQNYLKVTVNGDIRYIPLYTLS